MNTNPDTLAAPLPPPAPEPPPPAPPALPQKADIAVACPKQVAPEMPDKAVDEGISGTVRTELRIKGGKVVGVQILSGPRVFHAAVRAAVARYGCSTGDAEVTAMQEFAFKVD
jgi:protein TonB